MATRSNIGILTESDTIRYIYCHWDGYPDTNGALLKKYYTTPEQVKQLIDLGDLSILGSEIGDKQDFDQPHGKGWCLAYGRDRNEPGTQARTAQSMQQYLRASQQFNYLFKDGQWHCYTESGHEILIP